ncbi:hypothetical protein D6C86_00688 [Aureobasidium pullulans]|uniref:F-box domain-containing protein n=1 Tax=Aureobasidium pullulans TaxID=5580 RepID=A0A4S9VCC1_AURPU|nr:hypothetical protein D6C94_04234 [Aureobasidium pullulans]THZ48925.1 hypothetical protein D6C87_00508 [Aureobasidium pullulans]THZ67276.1 hypothetical protein D6C86_00688 [Aureobasidium pullulans]THZ81175.1 hypothetical protein D6C88_06369 [Aureobasidium pullulans]
MASFADLPTEMQTEVFSYLADDPKSLKSSIRVDRTWHQHTIGLLWQHSATEALCSITSVTRRQWYADKIHRFEVTGEYENVALMFVKFPNLTQVTFGPDSYSGQSYKAIKTRHFLSPTLRRLVLQVGCFYTLDTLDLISVCCPSLQDLRILARPFNVDRIEHLLGLIPAFPTLRRLEIGCDFGDLSRTALEHLGQILPMLDTFVIKGQHDLDSWKGFTGPLFSCLRILVFEYAYTSGRKWIYRWEDPMADEHLKILLKIAPSLKTYRILNAQYFKPYEVSISIPQV